VILLVGGLELARRAGGYNRAQYIAAVRRLSAACCASPMTVPPRLDMHRIRLLALAVALACPVLAFADEYADVNQLIRSGRQAEAIAKADQYLAARPRDPQMRFIKGVAQADAGRTADAVATFTALNQEYPELPEPYNNLAVIYASQSQFEKARAALEMAVRANPSYATAYENLGDVYAKLAAQSYAKAQQLDAANGGIAPKLTLIRQLFAPADKARAPVAPAASAPAPAR
jgi:tetratricopeptide (TPR) repeat protein